METPQPPQVPFNAPYPPQPSVGNGLAITSLILGIVGLCVPVLGGIAAIITGIIALGKTRDPNVRGRGMAIAGISLGGVGLVLTTPALLILMLMPNLSHARDVALRVASAAKLREIGNDALMYSNNNHDQLPSSFSDLIPYVNSPAVFIHPRHNPPPAIPADQSQWPQWVAANSDYVWIAHGSLSAISSPATVVMAHEKIDPALRGINLLYCDGHVEFIPMTEAQSAIDQSKLSFIDKKSGP